METQNRTWLSHSLFSARCFCKWVLLGLAMGGVVGLVGTGFSWAVDSVTALRQVHSWLLYLLPVAGVLIVGLYHLFGIYTDKGTNLVLLAVREHGKMDLRNMICIFTASVLTHLCGGSSGREGAALQIGGSMGATFSKVLKLDEADSRILVMSGMSACFAALFGTPVSAAFFAMEVISIGVLHYSALLPCMTAAITGSAVSRFFGMRPMSPQVLVPGFGWLSFGKAAVVALVCGLLSFVFCAGIHWAAKGYQRFLKNPYLRAAAGGGLVVLCSLLLGTRMYNGAGTETILAAFTQQQAWYVFLLKLLLTALTLGAGFKGGEIVPVFFVGSTCGSALSGLLGLDPSFAAAIGMISLFCGVTNCPLTTLFLSVELFGGEGAPFYGAAVAVAYISSGYAGLYSEQKILYSKFKPQFIDKKVG